MSILKTQVRRAMRWTTLRQQCWQRGAGLCLGGETFRFRPIGISADTLDRYTSKR